MDLIADRLRAGIRSGDLAPGQQLIEASLASRLQVSRSPLREAMQRLIQEGLLCSVRKRGVFVVELSESDMDDISLARGSVERTAAKSLLQNPREDVFERLAQIVNDMRSKSIQWSELVDLDLQFHTVLVDSVGSRRLTAFYRTLLTETRMSLLMLDAAYPRREDIASEHEELLSMIRSGNLMGLDDLIKSHMDHVGQRRRAKIGAEVSAPKLTTL